MRPSPPKKTISYYRDDVVLGVSEITKETYRSLNPATLESEIWEVTGSVQFDKDTTIDQGTRYFVRDEDGSVLAEGAWMLPALHFHKGDSIWMSYQQRLEVPPPAKYIRKRRWNPLTRG
jgi:hypothetical protein